jgi:hypothetical protein
VLLLLLLGRQFLHQTAHPQLRLKDAGGSCRCCCWLLLLLQAQGVKTTAKFDQITVDQAFPAEQRGLMTVPTHAADAAACLTAAAAAAAAGPAAHRASCPCYLTTLLHSNPLEPCHP